MSRSARSKAKHPPGYARLPNGDWRIYARVKPLPLRSRVLDADTPEDTVKVERELFVAELRLEAAGKLPPKATRDETLEAGAMRYLDAVTAMPTYKERCRHIALWVALLGKRPRHAITGIEIRAIRDRWLTVGPKMVQAFELDQRTGRRKRVFHSIAEPLSASQVNSRLRALENLYTVLDGRHAPNPVRDVPEAEEPEQPPRTVPLGTIRAIIKQMPASKAKARLSVLAWTGIPPATLKLILEDHFDAKAKAVWVPKRKKGKGTAGRWLPLGPDGVAAFKMLKNEEAFGPFSWDIVRRSFYAACRWLGISGIKPYHLRHAIAARTLAASGDFATTQQLLLHASPKTTARYAKAAIDPHLADAVKLRDRKPRGAKGRKEVARKVAQTKKRTNKR